MGRKRKPIQMPNQMTTDAAAMDIKPKTLEEFKQVAEREYAPEVNKSQVESVTFLGTGTYLPTIKGKTRRVQFAPERGYRFTANDPEIIEWCRGKNFKEAE